MTKSPPKTLRGLSDFDALYRRWLGEPVKVEDVGGAMRVYAFPPEAGVDEPFFTYLTAGMSLRKMKLPEGAEEHGVLPRTEYVFYASASDDRYVEMLKLLMEFPFEDETFVTFGQTVALAEPVDDGRKMKSVVLLTTLFKGHDDAFSEVTVKDEKIGYLWPVPISDSEKRLKVAKGLEALLGLMAEKGSPVVFRPSRTPMV